MRMLSTSALCGVALLASAATSSGQVGQTAERQGETTLVSYSVDCGSTADSCGCAISDCGPVADCCPTADCGECGCAGGGGWCDLGEPFVLWDKLWDKLHPCREPTIAVGGWFQAGYHSNQTPLSNAPGDLLAFNDLPDRLNLHQGWIYAEKALDTEEGGDWGFRVDMMYGTDGQKTQAFGNPPGSWDYQNGFDHGYYAWAIPQLYAEVGAGNWSVKAGHFFTLVGYEVVPATGNFFYSHALTMFNSEPFTHTGVLATYSGFEDATFYGGWTAGWDTGFDNLNGGSSFLGGLSLTANEDLTVTYIATAGNFGLRGRDGYSHSIVADATLTEKLNYVFQSDLVLIDSTQDDQVGINQYLFYTHNDCVKVGGRLEWWKSNGISYYEATGGVNLRAHANVVVRPEIRYDWTPTTTDPNVAYAGGNRTTFGIDAIATY